MKKILLILLFPLFVSSQCGTGNYKGLLTFSGSWQNTSNTGNNQRPYWMFNAVKNYIYNISNCNGTSEDTKIRIYDQLFNELAFNDDNGPYCASLNASLNWTCPLSGVYYIFLSHYNCSKLDNNQIISYKEIVSLPINLLSFTGFCFNNNIYLQWETSCEEGSNYVEVQKSTDAINYTTIASIHSIGEVGSLQTYKYKDLNVDNEQIYYYRLKQVDFDGNYEIFDPIFIQYCKDSIIINEIYDQQGRYLNTFTSTEIINTYNISKYELGLQEGLYFIKSKHNNYNVVMSKIWIK